MSTTSDLTIIIPAKNEAILLPKLLNSLAQQDYSGMPNTKVYVADAGSTDSTPAVARSFADRLAVEVIPGGLPAVGRNNGARRAATPYVLFVDADIQLDDPTLVRRAVELMRRKKLHCVTTNIHCPQGRGFDRVLYVTSNLAQQLSRLCRPFSTGMFMLFDKARFDELGGFHEGALYAEDYLLSKKVARRRFGIVRGHIITTNRRFKNMGYLTVAGLFLSTALNTWNDSFFFRDHRYWHSDQDVHRHLADAIPRVALHKLRRDEIPFCDSREQAAAFAHGATLGRGIEFDQSEAQPPAVIPFEIVG